jgi:hypothetical protein
MLLNHGATAVQATLPQKGTQMRGLGNASSGGGSCPV